MIATGSRPCAAIPGLDERALLHQRNLFDLRDKPEHLLIIGGGPIGMEMAQAHLRLGSKVTVIEGARRWARMTRTGASRAGHAARRRHRDREDAMAAKIAASRRDQVDAKTGAFSRLASVDGRGAQAEHRQAEP